MLYLVLCPEQTWVHQGDSTVTPPANKGPGIGALEMTLVVPTEVKLRIKIGWVRKRDVQLPKLEKRMDQTRLNVPGEWFYSI